MNTFASNGRTFISLPQHLLPASGKVVKTHKAGQGTNSSKSSFESTQLCHYHEKKENNEQALL